MALIGSVSGLQGDWKTVRSAVHLGQAASKLSTWSATIVTRVTRFHRPTAWLSPWNKWMEEANFRGELGQYHSRLYFRLFGVPENFFSPGSCSLWPSIEAFNWTGIRWLAPIVPHPAVSEANSFRALTR